MGVCYNRICSWSPMPCEKHGPWASVTTKKWPLASVFMSNESLVFHTGWETMIKTFNKLML